MHGKGKYTWANGNMYEGDYQTEKKHGKGTLTWANGDIYRGDFKDDKMHGKGTFIFISGGMYEGDYQDDNLYIEGKMINNNDNNVKEEEEEEEEEVNEVVEKNGSSVMKPTMLTDLPDDVFRLIHDFYPIKELSQVSRFFHVLKGRVYYYKFTKKHSVEYYVSIAFREHVQNRIDDVSQQLSLDLSSCSDIDVGVLVGVVNALDLSG